MQGAIPGFAFMNFAEIVPGLNVRVTKETLPRVALIDVTMGVCGQTRQRASQTFQKLDKEVTRKFGHFQFPGEVQRGTPVGTASEFMELVMMLPGKNAETFRVKAARIITRYYAGDRSMTEEIVVIQKKRKLEEEIELLKLECQVEELKKKRLIVRKK